MKIEITEKQRSFIEADADEVLFGGAAGGGKSYGQLVDALLYAARYAGSRQLILRRTFAELEKSIIRESQKLFPREIASYTDSKHIWKFKNGSVIDFGYCDAGNDVFRYQSAEYDVIRFDELTHFTEEMYTYLISRLRGANSFPKQVKSSTNPGNVGHAWVKKRFVDPSKPNVRFDAKAGSRIFIPSLVTDNAFLMESDPDYVRRLDNLPVKERKALKYGDWDIFEGQYFTEWDSSVHVCETFSIPKHWRRYFALDYGLDMLAGLFIAVDEGGRAYVTDEIYESGLIISEAAGRIKDMDAGASLYLAPPDLWNRRQESGKSAADIFRENGVVLTKSSANRLSGWLAVREWLKVKTDEEGKGVTSDLKIFRRCENLIRCLPLLRHDEADVCDVSDVPHELTHAPDALRYFCVFRTSAATKPTEKREYAFEIEKPKDDPIKGGDYIVI